MNEATVLATARRLANLSESEAPAYHVQDFTADDGVTPCWRVLFWASEEAAENDDGAKAIRSVKFAACDPDNTATIQ